MNVRQLLSVLRRSWVVLVLALVIGMAVGAAVAATATPRYQSTITMYLASQAQTGNADAAYAGALLSAQRVSSYTELFTSDRVAADVRSQLRLSESVETIRSEIAASSKPDSVLVTATVTDASAQRAADIANAAGVAFTGLVADLESSTVAGEGPAVVAKVAQPASVSTEAVSRRPASNIAAGGAVGLMIGVGLALARNGSRSLRGGRLAEVAGAPRLGEVHYYATPPGRRPVADEHGSSVGTASLATVRRRGEILYGRALTRRPPVVMDGEQAAEAAAKVATVLRFSHGEHVPGVVVVTSSDAGREKTVAAISLAAALGHQGRRVLLVDADLRCPEVAERTGLAAGPGLAELLDGQATVDEVVRPWSEGRIDVVAGGTPSARPTELLCTGPVATSLATFRRRYDVVIVDTPPVLASTDAMEVAARSDGVVLVASPDTGEDRVRSAVDDLSAVQARILGVVLASERSSSRSSDAIAPAKQGEAVAELPPAPEGRPRELIRMSTVEGSQEWPVPRTSRDDAHTDSVAEAEGDGEPDVVGRKPSPTPRGGVVQVLPRTGAPLDGTDGPADGEAPDPETAGPAPDDDGPLAAASTRSSGARGNGRA